MNQNCFVQTRNREIDFLNPPLLVAQRLRTLHVHTLGTQLVIVITCNHLLNAKILHLASAIFGQPPIASSRMEVAVLSLL